MADGLVVLLMEGWGQIMPFTGNFDQALICFKPLIDRLKPVVKFPDGMLVGVYWAPGQIGWRIPPMNPDKLPAGWTVVAVFEHKKET